jgi:oligosaccharide amylase
MQAARGSLRRDAHRHGGPDRVGFSVDSPGPKKRFVPSAVQRRSRMITLLSGNSRILLTVDERGNWSHLYYPYAGQFQHLHEQRVGLFDEDAKTFEWLGVGDKPRVDQGYVEHSNAGRTRHRRMDLEVTTDDMIHPNLDLVIRRITLRNPQNRTRRMRVFHYQSLTIMESLYQDTAYWDDQRKTINHYKRRYYFQFWGRPDFDAFTCGEHTLKGLKGSYVDAEDGQLHGSKISHGAADSCVQWNVEVPGGQERSVFLLVMIGRSRAEVNKFHDQLLPREPLQLAEESVRYWNNWMLNKRISLAEGLSPRALEVYKRSILVLHDTSSQNGSIIASPDPKTLKSGGDNYNYCWWRDGGYVSKAMDEVGLYQNANRFIHFAAECQEEEGYFLHRHFPDGSVGSTWHPPPFIQIDQTATVVSAVWHHFKKQGDLDELLENWPLVRKGADFLMRFVDERGLPKPSYDLWEEKFSINAYSVAAVVKGLESATKIGEQLGKRTGFWRAAQDRMRSAALQNLWNPKRGAFFKSIEPVDETIDASTLLSIKLGLLAPDDPRAATLVKTVEDHLWVKSTGGLSRYEGDKYYGDQNPWIICTLWLAEAHLMLGSPERCRELIEWAVKTASPTNLLPEQIDAKTGAHTSVTPLIWSHSTFLDVVNKYTTIMRGTRTADPKLRIAP